MAIPSLLTLLSKPESGYAAVVGEVEEGVQEGPPMVAGLYRTCRDGFKGSIQ